MYTGAISNQARFFLGILVRFLGVDESDSDSVSVSDAIFIFRMALPVDSALISWIEAVSILIVLRSSAESSLDLLPVALRAGDLERR